MDKYQFYISFEKQNNAGSKAIEDCTKILTEAGYQDLNIHLSLSSGKRYLLQLFSSVIRLLFQIKSNSILAIQYPLLSGNKEFKFILRALRLKKAKVFCIVHDIESLRYSKDDSYKTKKEIELLNSYDALVVHNEEMKTWLINQGIIRHMVTLSVFDYLYTAGSSQCPMASMDLNSIVFAGNLSKSLFIYLLGDIQKEFKIFGPNFLDDRNNTKNLSWMGSYPTDQIVAKLNGAFGLLWDGQDIDKLDEKLGNYLKYNSPHKVSLYIAAGIPVIAPKSSAIGKFVEENEIGFLINDVYDLNTVKITSEVYERYKLNIQTLCNRVRNGFYTHKAINGIEQLLVK
jgi:hypothetical protein